MRTIDLKHSDSLKTASKIFLEGGIVIFPTDTVYGIGCLLDEKAIKKLYQIKNRPFSQPTAVLFSEKIFSKIRTCENKRIINKIIKKYPMGKVTIIANLNNFKIKFPKILLKNNKIGFRIPSDQYLEKLIDKTGPIVASSANKAGEETPKSFAELDCKLLNEVDLVIKTNKVSSKSPSTVYDLEEDKIIRN